MNKANEIRLELVKLISLTNAPTNMSSFANIKGYHSKTNGEIANHRVNLNFNYGNALKKDSDFILNLDVKKHFNTFLNDFVTKLDSHIEYLKSNGAKAITIKHFESLYNKIDFDVYEMAYSKAYDSLMKVGEDLYFGGKKLPSTSKNPYLQINSTIKYHTEKDTLYIVGQKIKNGKTTLIKGSLNERKNNITTFARMVLEQNMKKHNYRMFMFNRIDILNAQKNSFKGSEISL